MRESILKLAALYKIKSHIVGNPEIQNFQIGVIILWKTRMNVEKKTAKGGGGHIKMKIECQKSWRKLPKRKEDMKDKILERNLTKNFREPVKETRSSITIISVR